MLERIWLVIVLVALSLSGCHRGDVSAARSDAFARQKETIGKLNRVADALRALAAREGRYPDDKRLVIPGTKVLVPLTRGEAWTNPPAWPVSGTMPVDILSSRLVSQSSRDLPFRDAWGNAILCGFTEDGRSFTLLSRGSDGVVDAEHQAVWPSDEAFRDIVMIDVGLVSSPEGITR